LSFSSFLCSNHRRISLTHATGGLLVDFGVLTLRPDVLSPEYLSDGSTIPRLPPSHPAVVEWRAMTVIELSVSPLFVLFDMVLMVPMFAMHVHVHVLRDRIADGLRRRFDLDSEQLTLAQVLESATWKGGREIARKRRPETGGPPIDIISDGTVF
jgi:hypothetical protein